MIELRWVEKTHTPEHDGATGFTYKVLQYRHHSPTVDASGRLTPLGNWSDWIDVPTVTE